MNSASPRPYRMTRRAEAASRTRDAIVDAAIEAFWADPGGEFTLEEVARAAGVSVQTVIRHFGGRAGLFEAAGEREAARIADERDPAAAASPADAVRQLVAHYERVGDRVIRMLAQEHRSPAVAAVAARGRTMHRGWCEAAFAPSLDGLTGPDRGRRLAQLATVCDVYTWKLLRRDAGLGRAETERALVELLTPLLEAP